MFWTITNCVLSFRLTNFIFSKKRFELLSDALSSLNTSNSFLYDKFYGIIINLENSKVTVVIFPNGHCNLTGCLNEMIGISAFLELIDLLNACFELINNVDKMPFVQGEMLRISNICGTFKLGYEINIKNLYSSGVLKGLQVSLDQNNENRILYYPCKDNSTCFVLFRSGTINVVGGKSIENINKYFVLLNKILFLFKR